MKAPDKFITFLRESGAEVLVPTNEYEIVRFRTVNGVSVMYQGRRGYSYTGDAREAWDTFAKKGKWIIRSRARQARDKLIAQIIERDDGAECFYCGKITTPGEDQTLEHILSVSEGGNNNLKNLCIACHSCNQAVDNMSIVEKIYYRDVFVAAGIGQEHFT